MTTITREEVKAFIEQIESDLSNGWEAQITLPCSRSVIPNNSTLR